MSIRSWVAGRLKQAFSASTPCPEWQVAHRQMADTFGTINIFKPPNDGKIQAFFAKQTLIGDEMAVDCTRYSHPCSRLAMNEAVGTGKDQKEAIIDLWKKMTTLAPHETILQQEKTLYKGGEESALYNSWIFLNGKFQSQLQVKTALPPARPKEIEFLLNSALDPSARSFNNDLL